MLLVSPEWAIAHFLKANTISPTSKKAVSLSSGNQMLLRLTLNSSVEKQTLQLAHSGI
jgi:hypothetical protein